MIIAYISDYEKFTWAGKVFGHPKRKFGLPGEGGGGHEQKICYFYMNSSVKWC